MVNVKRSATAWIQCLCVLFLCVWSISPPLEIDTIYRLLALGCVGVWFVLALIRKMTISKQHTIALFFICLVIIVNIIENQGFSKVLSQISLYMLVIFCLMFGFYKHRWGELYGVILVVIALLCVFNFRTISELMTNPHITRYIVRDDEAMYPYLRQGVGGYSLIYPQVCLFPVFLSWTLAAFRHHKLFFSLGCVWLASYLILILRAGYSIAIVSSILGLIILFFYRLRSVVPAVIISILIFVGLMFLIVYSTSLQEYLLKAFKDSAIEKKITDLINSVTSRQVEGSILVRVERYESSITTFLIYPITGGLWFGGGGGGHSAIMDIFAKYGIFGGVLYTKLICTTPIYIKSRYFSPKIDRIMNAALISMLFVAVLDSFPYAFMCMIIIVMPLLIVDIRRWERER